MNNRSNQKRVRPFRFAIIGALNTSNTRDLISEIDSRGHIASNLSFINFYSKGTSGFALFDIYIFRTGHNQYPHKLRDVVQKLLRCNKTVIDEVMGKNYRNGKLAQSIIFSDKNINHPETYPAKNNEATKKILDKMSFPIIVKPDLGCRGHGIHLIRTKKATLDFLAIHPKGYLIQKYLPIDGDIRVMFVGHQPIGAIKRHQVQGDFRSNVSLGAKTEKVKINPEMRNLSQKAVAALGIEIAGIDLVKFHNKYYVLEVNEGPQWQGFKKTTGINPAKYIISYAIKKHTSLKNL